MFFFPRVVEQTKMVIIEGAELLTTQAYDKMSDIYNAIKKIDVTECEMSDAKPIFGGVVVLFIVGGRVLPYKDAFFTTHASVRSIFYEFDGRPYDNVALPFYTAPITDNEAHDALKAIDMAGEHFNNVF